MLHTLFKSHSLHSFQVPNLALLVLSLPLLSRAQVTVYTTYGASAASPTPPNVPCIGAQACDQVVMPLIPNPPVAVNAQPIPIQLLSGGMPGLGLPVSGDFQGFSIELSIANQVMGNRGNDTNPIFLNLMSTITSRSGRILIRIGGNSQEAATVVPGGLPNDTAIFKTDKTSYTPKLLLSPNLIEVMGNISQFVNVGWFIGLPFNDTNDIRPELAELSQAILGPSLLGMQLANEPDLYYNNHLRPATYTVQDFFSEWGLVQGDYKNNPNIPNKNIFVAPSICCGQDIGWTPEVVWATGFLEAYAETLSYISVEHYPTNNCANQRTQAQLLSAFYANHSAVFQLSAPYIASTLLAQQYNKPFIMFETNTASCGGFPGLSDSFQSALWSIDYNMNMAANNFSNALYHSAGTSDFYNAFTPPPTNQSKFHQWSIGPTMYSTIVTAEALGTSGKAQVVDLNLVLPNGGGGDLTPGYAVYESGTPQRVVLINYLTDPTGAANYTAFISVGGNATGQPGATPTSVTVKYLLSPSANEKWNISWAGQTFGGPFASDGRLVGTEQVYTISCDVANNVCPITVPAPGVAIVFLSQTAADESGPSTTATYATTVTKSGAAHHPTMDPSALAISNGHKGQDFEGLGSTSPGSSSGATGLKASAAMVVVAALMSSMFLLRLR